MEVEPFDAKYRVNQLSIWTHDIDVMYGDVKPIGDRYDLSSGSDINYTWISNSLDMEISEDDTDPKTKKILIKIITRSLKDMVKVPN